MPNPPAYRTGMAGQPTGMSPGLAMPVPQTAGLITPMPVQPGVKPAGASLTSPVGKPGANVIPVSGMVPIRNSLYDQSGLTSSVLLQPLNEVRVSLSQ